MRSSVIILLELLRDTRWRRWSMPTGILFNMCVRTPSKLDWSMFIDCLLLFLTFFAFNFILYVVSHTINFFEKGVEEKRREKNILEAVTNICDLNWSLPTNVSFRYFEYSKTVKEGSFQSFQGAFKIIWKSLNFWFHWKLNKIMQK